MKKKNIRKLCVRAALMALMLCLSMGAYAQAAQWKKTARGTRYQISKGKYAKNGWKRIKGKRYYFDSRGYLQTGWLKIDGDLYFLHKKTGERISGRWIKVGNNYYYAAKDGKIQKKKWIKNDYYVKSSGKRASGWLKIGNYKYYFDRKTGKRTTGWEKLGDKRYYFDSKGRMAENKFIKKSGKRYYLQQDGVMATGLKTINGAVYYFRADGAMVTGRTVTVSGKRYTFEADGKWDGKEFGEKIAAYAKKFLGNPYVYGGISLTKGADCSGFTYSVMKHFKIRIPRVADDQCKGNDSWGTYAKSTAVKPNLVYLKAGDLVFYGKPSHHVALYIGGGKVIHAMDESTGITISNYNYAKPSAARRYW